MKKKIFFLLPTLSCGGAERAAVALLNAIDFSKYDCDLMLFRRDDMYFLEELPKEINILDNDLKTNICLLHIKHIFKLKYIIRYFNLIVIRTYCTIRLKINKLLKIKSVFYDWDYIKKYIPNLQKDYDVAISILEGTPNFYIAEKVEARIKIGWIRADYEKWGYKKNHDIKYFAKLDYLFSVSDANAEKMKVLFPELKDKIRVMYNLLDYKKILELAKEEINYKEFNDYTGIKIISIGNLRYVKGYDRSIEACKILVEKKYDFRWYIIGEGTERLKLEKLIKKYKLTNYIFLLGLKRNPYPYFSQGSIYVQASRHEGYSTTIREAKLFNIPIVITDCPGMSDQIINGYTGFIANSDATDLSHKIELLLSSIELRRKISGNLEKIKNSDNEYELSKITSLFDK